MSKPFTLQSLLHLAQQKNDAAAKKLGLLNQQEQTAQAKLAALLQYRRDYQLKFEEAARIGMSPADMRNFQDFIARLDHAIAQQQGAIEKAKAGVQAGRNELMDATRKMKSFDTLAQRHHDSEKKREARNEQRQQDEISGRLTAYRSKDSEQ